MNSDIARRARQASTTSGRRGGRRLRLARLAAAVFLAGACNAAPERARSTAEGEQYVNGRWFDGERFRADSFYVVGGLLTRARPAVVRRVIDLGGGYVVPPFGEAHNHNVEGAWAIDSVVARYLRDGVFYVAIPGNIPELSARIADRVNAPTSIDVSFANAGITGPGGHPIPLYEDVLRTTRYEPAIGLQPRGWFEGRAYFVIDSEADLRERWGAITASRPDFIKTYLVHSEDHARRRATGDPAARRGLDPALLPAVIERAHADSLRVAVHVETAEDFRTAVREGADIITHLPGWLVLSPDDARAVRLTTDDAALAARAGVVVITTTVAARHMGHMGHTGHMTASSDVLAHNLRLLHAGGVVLAIGSDHAETSLEEAMNLHALGVFDNATLLRMWSETTPRVIFPGRRIGRLEEGYEASFLVLAGDPIADFSHVRAITMRTKQGRELPSARR